MVTMQGVSQKRSLSYFFFLSIVLSGPLLIGQRAQQSIAGEIHGQVRIDNQPAPPGLLVLLDVAPGMQSGLVGNGQTSRTTTDSAGKFTFDNVPVVRGVQEKFLVTIQTSGYRTATYVVDFGGSPRTFAN